MVKLNGYLKIKNARVRASFEPVDPENGDSDIVTLTATLEDGSTKTYKLYGKEV